MSLDDDIDLSFLELQNKIVKLNVGGTYFETYIGTLINNSIYFKNLFCKFKYDDREIFIDRSPDNFNHVLNYIRDPHYAFPWNIIYELDWFGISYNKNKASIQNNNIKQSLDHIAKNHNLETSKYDAIQGGLMTLITGSAVTKCNNDLPSLPMKKYLNGRHIYPTKSSSTIATFDMTVKKINGQDKYFFNILRYADLITNMTLYIKLSNSENININSRYKLFESIALSIGGIFIESQSSILIELIEKLYLTSKQKKANHRFDQNGDIMINIPFYWYKKTVLPIIKFRSDIELSITGIDFKGVDSIKLIVDYIYLDSHERRKMVDEQTFVEHLTKWNEYTKELKSDETVITINNISYNAPINKFIFIIKTNNDQFIPIKSIKISGHGQTIFFIDGCIILHKMINDYNIILDEAIYYYTFSGENVALGRMDNVSIEITLFEELLFPAKLYYFYQSDYKYNPWGHFM